MTTIAVNTIVYVLHGYMYSKIPKYDAGEEVVSLIYKEQQLSKSKEKINNFYKPKNE